MAQHFKDDVLHGEHHNDTHASSSRWRHEESTSFAKHAGVNAAPAVVRDADERVGTNANLVNFLNEDRIKPLAVSAAVQDKFTPILVDGHGDGSGLPRVGPDAVDLAMRKQLKQTSQTIDDEFAGGIIDGREVRCGPLLNYRRMEGSKWFGSVLIVLRAKRDNGEEFVPELKLAKVWSQEDDRHHSRTENGVNGVNGTQDSELHVSFDGASASKASDAMEQDSTSFVKGEKLFSDPLAAFWRFTLSVEMENAETQWEYQIPGLHFPKSGKTDKQRFFVPGITESMRIMFHSCNGFSAGTDEKAWSGPALWNDVQRVHSERPFHVMIGGGDQIYNDGVRVGGPLRPWTDIGNPKKRREYPFPEALRKECDDYYLANYIRWFTTEPFAGSNGQIPQLNLWDDHDIIDGFGSYVDEFMSCDVFRGIGGIAYKYYMLFQHHLPPSVSTFTTDAPQTEFNDGTGVGSDAVQTKNTFVLENEKEDPSYIIGKRPGPYVEEHSRSIYTRLGARIAFFGLDGRTERTRHQINYPETYQMIIQRLKRELGASASSGSPIKHLIVLLGIPIAYPRLTWLENIFSSPLMGPIKFLNKRFGFAGGFINKFDGSVELLDDLDDHYTAGAHKKERHELVIMLQNLAAEFSVRITILSGDVHLAAIGRFYSNPKLNTPVVADHRYMVNIVSSAIVNKPPPNAIATLLAKRNKLHHLDGNTDETLMEMFDKDPGTTSKTRHSNHVTMPSRNWCMITENSLASASNPSPSTDVNGANASSVANGVNGTNGTVGSAHGRESELWTDDEPSGKDGHSPLGPGELNAGTNNRAASDMHGKYGDDSLDICIRVEKDQHDPDGRTQSYGMWIPVLNARGEVTTLPRKRDAVKNHAHLHQEKVVHRDTRKA